MDIELKFDDKGILDGLEKLRSRAEKKLRVYADTSALKMENKAKNDAKWIDRTGDARRSIKGFAKKATNKEAIRITLQDGVYYGKYLEYCNGGKYAVIEPTVDSEAPQLVEGMKDLF